VRASILGLSVLTACHHGAGPGDGGLTERPSNPTCVAVDRPASDVAIALTPVFGALAFHTPVAMEQAPGDGSRWYVVEKSGTVKVFANEADIAASSTFIDVASLLQTAGQETGLLGMAFHPDFATNGYVYLSFTGDVDGQLSSVIERFTSTDGGATATVGSGKVILTISQPYSNHNGGNILFGPDGYLYAGFGDGGSEGDPRGNGQDTSLLLSKMLRIDVDGGDPYAIPADNPFADGQGGRPEIYANGLRNPWRWSFDRATGDLWVGDVGQDAWEEIDIVENGGNYGWSEKEGTHCYAADSPCDNPEWIDPIVEYGHDEGASVCGGYVYRGTANPDLVGTYLFADTYEGTIWGLTFDPIGGEPHRVELAGATGLFVTSFGEGVDGELYVVDYGGGRLYRVDPAGAPTESTFPALLSQTGCVDAADPTKPAAGLIPYEPAVALWSDGADKGRWMGVPDGGLIAVGADGAWDFPIGTVLMKEFDVGGDRVETRLLMLHDDGNWSGYSYRWNDAGTDAELLPSSASRDLAAQTWHFPSRAQCLECHTEASGRVLGLRTEQLNSDYDYGGGATNQVATLAAIGMFAADPGDPAELDAMPAIDGDAPVEDRAMAYLAANCSQCHRPDGTGGGGLDLSWGKALADRGLCGVAPDYDLGVAGAKIVTPGDPSASVLSLRMHATDVNRMPPLASSLVDPDGTALIDAWITSLAACP
jgi:uncharacterized repeat protein (TIGR03806 family)